MIDRTIIAITDIKDILAIPLLGVIPESTAVLKASNLGIPVTFDDNSDAGHAYRDSVDRLLGEELPIRFTSTARKGILQRLFGKNTEEAMA